METLLNLYKNSIEEIDLKIQELRNLGVDTSNMTREEYFFCFNKNELINKKILIECILKGFEYKNIQIGDEFTKNRLKYITNLKKDLIIIEQFLNT